MAIGRPIEDLAPKFNSVYRITGDMSGWSQATIQAVAPLNGAIVIYASNDSGAVQGVTQGNAQLATNFEPILVTNLATGTTTNEITTAGLYVATINAQFLQLQGQPAAAGTNVYKLLIFNSKID